MFRFHQIILDQIKTHSRICLYLILRLINTKTVFITNQWNIISDTKKKYIIEAYSQITTGTCTLDIKACPTKTRLILFQPDILTMPGHRVNGQTDGWTDRQTY